MPVFIFKGNKKAAVFVHRGVGPADTCWYYKEVSCLKALEGLQRLSGPGCQGRITC